MMSLLKIVYGDDPHDEVKPGQVGNYVYERDPSKYEV